MYYPFETQVTPLTIVRRRRMLPAPGTVEVRIGDQVEPPQVIAHAELPGDFRIVPVARLLDIPASRVNRYIRVKPGEDVREGQVIAKRGRLFASTVTSPFDGMVTASGGGRILIEAHPTAFDLRAHMYGTVSNVLQQHGQYYGVVIETPGAVVQGAWSAGEESFGVLKCLAETPNDLLEAEAIDPASHGTILVGGRGLSDAALERAQQLQVRGIVVGGLSPELVPQAEQLPFPIIVTEGIGVVPMSGPIFHLLMKNDGREASVNGHMQTRWGIMRPEVIIPMPADTVPPAERQPGAPLGIGARVRLVRTPHAGKVGTVVALPVHARRIETGIRVHGAEVDVGQEAPIFAPLANVEVLR
jgi:hypothetical protein